MIKTAAVLSCVLGLGFGLPGAYGTWYFARHGEVWTFMGFPAYGGGPFEKMGLKTSVPLLVVFLIVCLSEIVIGWLLWQGLRVGGVGSIAILPVELLFWIGFALPFGPLLGVPRTILVILAWSSLAI